MTTDTTRSDPGGLNDKIADLYLGDLMKTVQPVSAISRPGNIPPAVDLPSSDLAEYAGDYYSDELPATYRFVVVGNELQLFGRKSNNPVAQPIGEDRFFFRAGMELRFVRDAQHRIRSLTIARAFTPLRDEAFVPRPALTFRRLEAGGAGH